MFLLLFSLSSLLSVHPSTRSTHASSLTPWRELANIQQTYPIIIIRRPHQAIELAILPVIPYWSRGPFQSELLLSLCRSRIVLILDEIWTSLPLTDLIWMAVRTEQRHYQTAEQIYVGAKLLWLALVGNFTVYLYRVNVIHMACLNRKR